MAFAHAYMQSVDQSGAQPNIEPASGANNSVPNAAAAAQNRRPENNPNPMMDINENEDANQDWTDLLYSVSKAMVMISIIYFYSSFNRLFLLISIGLLFYFYK